MIRLFMFVMIAVLTVAGCSSGPRSITGVGEFAPQAGQKRAPTVKVAHADVLVVFADIDTGPGEKYCPVAAVTVDTQCDGFTQQGLDIVCRWAQDVAGKGSAIKKVQWTSINAGAGAAKKFSIKFTGANPCSNAMPASGLAINCIGKDKAGLGLANKPQGTEVKLKYEVREDPPLDCPLLDPSTIWRR